MARHPSHPHDGTKPKRRARRPRRRPPASARSRFALDAVNFFLAELTGIGSPYLSDVLHDAGWRFSEIGLATAMPGVGVCLLQTAAGYYLDRSRRPREILAGAALLVGICYALLPTMLEVGHLPVYVALFVSGLAQSLFGPLLAGLALGLVGHGHLHRTAGANQAYNHIGDVAAALLALVIIRYGVEYVFYMVGVIAILAGASALVIKRDEIDSDRASGGREKGLPFRTMLRTRCILVLLACVLLFQAAYASAFPFVVIRVRELGGANSLVAAMVLITQAVMTPIAIFTGRFLQDWGRKPVWGFGFLTLPVYTLACALVRHVPTLVALQALGAIGPGILGVAVVVVCADLTRGSGHYHALMAAANTAMALGAVIGPFATGFLVGHLGHARAFFALTAAAGLAALLFIREMPETRPAEEAHAT